MLVLSCCDLPYVNICFVCYIKIVIIKIVTIKILSGDIFNDMRHISKDLFIQASFSTTAGF